MKRLRALRHERRWSAFELARRSRVNPSDVSAIELGRRVPGPGSIVLARLAEAVAWTGDPAALLEEVDGEDWS